MGSLASQWPDAEEVNVNGVPAYVRLYLRTDAQLQQAADMTRALLNQRL